VNANGSVGAYTGRGSDWTSLGNGFDHIYAGESGLVATRSDTHDLYRYAGAPGTWTKIGGPGDLFAVNADGVFGLNGAGVFRWTGTGTAWEQAGPTGTALYAAGHILAKTELGTGDLYRMTAPGAWTKTGGPGDGFAVNDDGIYGTNPGGVFHWTGTGTTWARVGNTQRVLFAGARTLTGIDPATSDINLMTSPDNWTQIGGPGDTFAVNADGVYGLNGGGIFRWTPAGTWSQIGPATRTIATD
jgi:hypothetical protein